MTSSDFRTEARRNLAGKWGKAACITLAYTFIFFVLGFIQGLMPENSAIENLLSLAITIIEVPFAFGLIISLYKLYEGQDIKAFDFITFGFNSFGKSWIISFHILLKMAVPVILIVTSIILIAFGIYGTAASSILSPGNSGSYLFIAIIGFVLYFVGLIWTIVKSYYYAITYIIAADNENMKAKELVEKSKQIMTNHRGQLFVLQLTFIGWAILAVFTLGIGYLWILPYMQFAMIAFYKHLIGDNQTVITEKVDEDTDNGPIQ